MQLYPFSSTLLPSSLQLANVSSSPRFPAGVARRLDGLQGACPCRVAGANARSCERWKPGYLVLYVREVGFVLPIPCGIRAGGAWGHLDWGALAFPLAGCVRVWAAPKQGRACDACLLFPLSSCPSLGGPALETVLPVPVEACPASAKSLGASARGNPLLGLGGSLLWLVIPQSHGILSVEQCFLQGGGGSTSPTPALPHLLLPSASSVKLLPAFLPQNNLFCHPDSWGLKGKSSLFRESLFVFPVTSLFNGQRSQLWHSSPDRVPCYCK